MANGIPKPSGGSLAAAFGARFFDTLSRRLETGRGEAREERLIGEQREYETGVREKGREWQVEDRELGFKREMDMLLKKWGLEEASRTKAHQRWMEDIFPREREIAKIRTAPREPKAQRIDPREAANIMASYGFADVAQADPDLWGRAITALGSLAPDDIEGISRVTKGIGTDMAAKYVLRAEKGIQQAMTEAGARFDSKVFDMDDIAVALQDTTQLGMLEDIEDIGPMTLGEVYKLLQGMNLSEKQIMGIINSMASTLPSLAREGLMEEATGMDRDREKGAWDRFMQHEITKDDLSKILDAFNTLVVKTRGIK